MKSRKKLEQLLKLLKIQDKDLIEHLDLYNELIKTLNEYDKLKNVK